MELLVKMIVLIRFILDAVKVMTMICLHSILAVVK